MKEAAIGLAGVACLGTMAGCSNTGAAAAGSADLPQRWDYEAEIVVCGFGAAGAMAAREAIAQGCSCLVIEKADEANAGGASTCCGGYFMSGQSTSDLIADSNGYLSEGAAKKFLDGIAENIEWCLESGLKATPLTGTGPAAAAGGVVLNMVKGNGVEFYRFLSDAVTQCGTEVLYGTAATKLVYDTAKKTVCGVQAADAGGAPLNIKATRGVILATGNMAGNRDLIDRFFLPNGIDTAHVGSPYNTGEGFIMAQEIGASVKSLNCRGLELYSFCLTKASSDAGSGITFNPMGAEKDAYIFVNPKGKRFVNENSTWGHYKGTQPWLDFQTTSSYRDITDLGWTNLPMYVVFDSKIMGSAPLTSNTNTDWMNVKGGYSWSADNKAELDKGWIVKGDTIEELVKNLAAQSGKSPISAAGLQATIERYNRFSATGTDGDYGRQGLLALDTPPFYAAQLSVGLLYTIGGLRIGENAETLDWNDKPISGLYHAGDIGQVNELNSQGIVGAMSYGAMAARALASAESRTIAGAAATVIDAPSGDQIDLATNGL